MIRGFAWRHGARVRAVTLPLLAAVILAGDVSAMGSRTGQLARALRMPETMLVEALIDIRNNRLDAALKRVDMLLVVKPDFRLAQLVQLAYLNRFLHHLLVSTAERFRLRVYVLQRGFRTVGALALRWRAAPTMPWSDLAAAHHDVGTPSEESLESLRVLLVSLDAERRL